MSRPGGGSAISLIHGKSHSIMVKKVSLIDTIVRNSYAHDARDISQARNWRHFADVSFKLGQNNMYVMCDNK